MLLDGLYLHLVFLKTNADQSFCRCVLCSYVVRSLGIAFLSAVLSRTNLGGYDNRCRHCTYPRPVARSHHFPSCLFPVSSISVLNMARLCNSYVGPRAFYHLFLHSLGHDLCEIKRLVGASPYLRGSRAVISDRCPLRQPNCNGTTASVMESSRIHTCYLRDSSRERSVVSQYRLGACPRL